MRLFVSRRLNSDYTMKYSKTNLACQIIYITFLVKETAYIKIIIKKYLVFRR